MLKVRLSLGLNTPREEGEGNTYFSPLITRCQQFMGVVLFLQNSMYLQITCSALCSFLTAYLYNSISKIGHSMLPNTMWRMKMNMNLGNVDVLTVASSHFEDKVASSKRFQYSYYIV